MGKYFGTDGVRGVANRDLTPELAYAIGRAAAAVIAHAQPMRQADRRRTRHAAVRPDAGRRTGRGDRVDRPQRRAARHRTDPRGRRHHDEHRSGRRRDDLRVAQPDRGQRHQALRGRRVQAHRRLGSGDRGADRDACGAAATDGPRHRHRLDDARADRQLLRQAGRRRRRSPRLDGRRGRRIRRGISRRAEDLRAARRARRGAALRGRRQPHQRGVRCDAPAAAADACARRDRALHRPRRRRGLRRRCGPRALHRRSGRHPHGRPRDARTRARARVAR